MMIDRCIGLSDIIWTGDCFGCYLDITTESTIRGEWWWENFNGGILLCISFDCCILCLGLTDIYTPFIELGLIVLLGCILWYWIGGERILCSIGW